MIVLKWLHVHLEINPMMKNIQGTPTRAVNSYQAATKIKTS